MMTETVIWIGIGILVGVFVAWAVWETGRGVR